MVYLGPINPHTMGMLRESQLEIEGFTPYGIDLIRENERITQYAAPFPKSREPNYEPVEPLRSREPNNSLFNYQAPEPFVFNEPKPFVLPEPVDYLPRFNKHEESLLNLIESVDPFPKPKESDWFMRQREKETASPLPRLLQHEEQVDDVSRYVFSEPISFRCRKEPEEFEYQEPEPFVSYEPKPFNLSEQLSSRIKPLRSNEDNLSKYLFPEPVEQRIFPKPERIIPLNLFHQFHNREPEPFVLSEPEYPRLKPLKSEENMFGYNAPEPIIISAEPVRLCEEDRFRLLCTPVKQVKYHTPANFVQSQEDRNPITALKLAFLQIFNPVKYLKVR